jgi:hypothetical protein
MKGNPALTLIAILLLFTASAGTAAAELYDKCPDHAFLRSNIGQPQYINFASSLCDNTGIGIYRNKYLIVSWIKNSPNPPPFNGTVEDGTVTIVNSATLVLAMKTSSQSNINTDIWVWNCTKIEYEFPYDLAYTISVPREGTVQELDITEYVTGCTDKYEAWIFPNLPSDSKDNVTISKANLTIDYEKEPLNQPGELSVAISPPSVSQYRGTPFNVTGRVKCSGGDCGEVSAALRYNGSSPDPDTPILPSYSTPMYIAYSSGTDCGQMAKEERCLASWTLNGTLVGAYLVDINATSTLSQGADSPDIPVSINSTPSASPPPGTLSASCTISPESIYTGEGTTLSCEIGCQDGYCGKVTATAKYGGPGGTKITSTSPKLNTTGPNPRTCGSFPCAVSWNINASEAGTYSVGLVAESNYTGVDSTSDFSNTLTVTDPGVPPQPALIVNPSSLDSIQNPYIVGGQFVLSGTVTCYNADCGQVTATAKHDGSQIGTSGSINTTDTNPMTFSLNEDQSHDVQWDLGLDETGEYELGIFADGGSGVGDGSRTGIIEIEPEPEVIIEVHVLSPSSGQTFRRGDAIFLKAQVTEDGAPRAGLDVTASCPALMPTATLYDKGDGSYEKTVQVPSGADAASYEIDFAASGIHGYSVINIDPEILDVNVEAERSNYTILDELVVEGHVSRDGTDIPADVRITISSGIKIKEDTIHTVDGFYRYTYQTTSADPVGTWTVRAKATDDNGNIGSGITSVTVEENPGLIKYGMEFRRPSGNDVFHRPGDDMIIEVYVSGEG